VQVLLSALPPGVSLVTAEAVLFVGKARRILLGWPRGSRGRHVPPMPSAAVQQFASTLRELQRQPTLDQIKLEQAVNAVNGEVTSAVSMQIKRRLPRWRVAYQVISWGPGDSFGSVQQSLASRMLIPSVPS
jgi:hypothetical protein